jgi:glycosyltransferase involved in cell wall biosynthesis
VRRFLRRAAHRVVYELRRGRRLLRDRRRHRAIVAAGRSEQGIHVSYGYDRVPGPGEVAFGGFVKFQLLARELPNEPRRFNVLYLGSSSMPLDAAPLVKAARRRGARFVWNQNGTAYRGWYGDGYERLNRPRARLLHEADHVLYQSAFSKLSADRFYGERTGPWEILYNPVDIEHFTPAPRAARPLTLLLGGNQYQRYRFEVALQTLARLPGTRLVVTGGLTWSERAEQEGAALADELGVADRIEPVGLYTQAEAPAILRLGDILLHTKYNDPCPTIVLEAMACGLPVVYSATGGVPELVGDDAGIGVPSPLDWEVDRPPDPDALADAVLAVAERLDSFGDAARVRAQAFDARLWIRRHRELFEELVG